LGEVDLLNRVFVPRRDAKMVAHGNGGVLIDTSSGSVFELNTVAREVWSLISEGHAGSDICEHLASRYAVDRRTLEADVTTLLNNLSERGLIATAAGTTESDAG
jgi:hypothetical protein